MPHARLSFCAALAILPAALAQWAPASGQWGRTDTRDVRIMTWNVRDAVCSTSAKAEGANNWCAVARIIAAMKPDILIMQECGDNSGNGTGGSGDSQSALATTLSLLVNGGADPFHANAPVSSWVRKYDPNLAYPYLYASGNSDGFNRNVILSRYPFADLNGDSRATYDQFSNSADLYAPGGGPGIRGWTLAEINLPDAAYRGDLVIGNSHLKSGGTTSDFADRLEAGQNIAYFIDYWYNGAGGTTPDPRARIADFPQATRTLDPSTPVVWGGDCNEDERDDGRDGPILWMTRAQAAGDGTDRDRSDCLYDDSRDPLNTNASSRNTQGSSKLDYLCWQDSIATLRRSFIYNSASGGPAAYPPELIGYPTVALASTNASDHRPVIADLILPEPLAAPGPFSLTAPANGSSAVTPPPTFSWSPSANAATYTLRIANNPDLTGAFTMTSLTATTATPPDGVVNTCGSYWWSVDAVNPAGTRAATNGPATFTTLFPPDFNRDGFADFFDYDAFVLAYETGC